MKEERRYTVVVIRVHDRGLRERYRWLLRRRRKQGLPEPAIADGWTFTERGARSAAHREANRLRKRIQPYNNSKTFIV